MSDIQIAATLKTMSETLQTLEQSLDNEKIQHLQLLKKLNLNLSNSQETIESNVLDFFKKIELTALIDTINKSRDNIEKQQENIQLLNEQIELISNQVQTSLDVLSQKTKYISEQIQKDSNLIQSTIVKNVAVAVKEQIINNFNSQFEEQNSALLSEIEKVNITAVNNIISAYNFLIEQADEVKEKHNVDLKNFQSHVDKFNKNINLAIKNVGDAFTEVEKNCRDNINTLYSSCSNFQNRVIEKLNSETVQINEFFDQKINQIATTIESSCNTSLNTLSNTEKRINKKSNEIVLLLEKNVNQSLGLTEKIIEKQESIYKNLCEKLNLRYFSFNTSSFLIVALVILTGLNIAASNRYEEMQNYNLALTSKVQQLQSNISELQTIRSDSIALTKQSINQVRKKFPQFQMTLNCKALD